jgi:hypothetical protein
LSEKVCGGGEIGSQGWMSYSVFFYFAESRRHPGGRWRARNQCRVYDRAAAQQGAARLQVLSDGREHGFRQIVTFEQVTEVEDRRLVGNCIATELFEGLTPRWI